MMLPYYVDNPTLRAPTDPTSKLHSEMKLKRGARKWGMAVDY